MTNISATWPVPVIAVTAATPTMAASAPALDTTATNALVGATQIFAGTSITSGYTSLNIDRNTPEFDSTFYRASRPTRHPRRSKP